MAREELARFDGLTYEDFRRLALDDSLSPQERIGFPDEYRVGKEEAILRDIVDKVPALAERCGMLVVDIGPGCSDLPRLLSDLCARQESQVVLVDSAEMLSRLPDAGHVRKRPGRFPEEEPLDDLTGRADVVLVYSVLHYVFAEGNLVNFYDRALAILAPGGRLLLGDIPNVSRRKRFFASETGRRFHREFMQSSDDPAVSFNALETGRIDDAIVLMLLSRARLAGFDAFVVPQSPDLPMANRREDVLVVRP